MAAKKKSILIVEDEELQRDLLRRAFEKEGYLVHTAEDGAEGLEKAGKLNPSVIVLDLVMPLGDGITLLYKINTDPALRSVPVVVLTNLAMQDKIKEAMNVEKDHFFTKTNHSLQEIISQVKAIA